MKKFISKILSEKAILLLIGIGIWALVLQNAGVIPSNQGVYVNDGDIDISGSGVFIQNETLSVDIDKTVDVNIKEVHGRSTSPRYPLGAFSPGVLPVKIDR
jgi:hypothetical protein